MTNTPTAQIESLSDAELDNVAGGFSLGLLKFQGRLIGAAHHPCLRQHLRPTRSIARRRAKHFHFSEVDLAYVKPSRQKYSASVFRKNMIVLPPSRPS